MKQFGAEFIGTFWLVFGGCGSAVYAVSVADGGIGHVGVALAFGLTVLTMAYTIGHISGCHLNPAVSIGMWFGGRLSSGQLAPYIAAQLLGGVVAGWALYMIASGRMESLSIGGVANGYGELSPDGYGLSAVLAAEALLTAFFVLIILGSTDKRAPQGLAPVAIGFGLTLIHLISIPISNTSVNPARSLAVAFYQSGALAQVWVFFVAPIAGAFLGAAIYKFLGSDAD